MGTLHKYIFKQVLGTAMMTLALFVFVLVIGNVIKSVMPELISGRISVGLFFYIIALIVPAVIPYALPMGMLTGILLVFGRMSAQSEIVSIKASGRSVLDMAVPVFFIAICATISSLAINFYYAPLANFAYKSALKNVIKNNPLQFVKPGYFVRDFPGFILYANSAENKILQEFRIWELNRNGDVKVSTQSKTANITYDETHEELVITLNNGSADYRQESADLDFSKPIMTVKFEELSVKLPLSEIIGSFGGDGKKLKLMTFGELMSARQTHAYKDGVTDPTPEQKFKAKIIVQTQIQKSFAMAFSIFSLTVLAIPLGIKASRSETFANVGIALVLSMSYYLLTTLITWFDNYPSMRPDIIIWIPNFIFLILGGILLIRAQRN